MNEETRTVAELLDDAKEALARPDHWDGQDSESDRLRKLDVAVHLLLEAVQRLHEESEQRVLMLTGGSDGKELA